MKIELDLKYKLLKSILTAANVTGNVDINFKGESLMKGVVKNLIIDKLREKGLTGTIVIDNEKFDLDKLK
ncbi:hypothetical protein [Candidatus Parabeggiatoa sp. HSG14]|uniref:hypothetical protein n=1 Tax=Candidatus Parabeggiatoa sp. HSG14 TaxID=3055593 RepID=UPI0025A70B02|nr:hypothetical protein [Thiotrichales bacterium HSG14]